MNFPATSWTILAEATLSGGDAERQALEKFCERYWEPVSTVIRARGVPTDRVEDLTQDFFLNMMESGFFRRAVSSKGKFRSFLLTALRNFLVDDVRKNSAIKRGGDWQQVELQEDVGAWEEDSLRFDLVWAETLFDSAVALTSQEVVSRRGKLAWNEMQGFLTGMGQLPSYENLGRALGIGEGGAKSEVSRTRKRFREHLRAEVARTVSAPHEIDEELDFLRNVMMQSSFGKDV